MDDFIKEYGIHGLTLLISKFIEKSPDFPGGEELAGEIGKAMGTLECCLANVYRDYKRSH